MSAYNAGYSDCADEAWPDVGMGASRAGCQRQIDQVLEIIKDMIKDVK